VDLQSLGICLHWRVTSLSPYVSNFFILYLRWIKCKGGEFTTLKHYGEYQT